MPAGKGYTVTYDGVASTTLTGFMCHEVERGLIAARRESFQDIPGMEGAYLFPEEPGMRTIDLDCSVLVDTVSPTARRAAVREVAAWYNRPTLRKLIISDEPDVYDMAIPASAPNVREWRQRGSFPLPFLCEPYSYQLDLQSQAVVGDASTKTVVINNDGDVWTPFIVAITMGASSPAQYIDIGDRRWQRDTTSGAATQLVFNTRAGVITVGANIDTDLQGLFDPDDVSMDDASGRPPFLEPGANTLEIAVGHTGWTATVLWRGRYS